MGFLNLRTYQFRNLIDGETELDSPAVFLVGENGQGKSNFLEALYLLRFGSSFRTRQEKNLPLQGTAQFALHGNFSGAFGPNKLSLKWEGQKKEIFLDDTPLRDRRELLTLNPTILFSHEDFLIVRGEPENQRTYFDQTLAFLDPVFLETLRNYRKVLKTRNFLLKSGDDFSLDVWDHQLVALGLVLRDRRKALVEECNQHFSPVFEEVSGGLGIKIHYSPSWKDETSAGLEEFLREKRALDRQMNVTTSGPHRDRFRFTKDGKNFAETASTGQIRLISLVLKLVQGRLAAQATGKKPVLLLDDVLLELDPTRRKRLFQFLPEADQAVFTFLPDQPLGPLSPKDGLIYGVKEGKLERL